MLLGLEFAPIYIDHIGKGLEGIEGNPDRKDYIEGEALDVEGEKIEEVDGALDEEIEVFEEDKCPDADDDRQDQPKPPPTRFLAHSHKPGGKVGDQGRPQD